MTSEDIRGFPINQKTVSYFLSLVAALGVFWQVAGYARELHAADLATNVRIDKHDTWIEQREKNGEKTLAKLEKQGQDIADIKVLLAELKAQIQLQNRKP